MTECLLQGRKWVLGYEGMYSVSEDGFVYSHRRCKSGKIMKGGLVKDKKNRPNCEGYKVVCLTKDGVSSTPYVHRIVAEVWVPNLEDKPCVNHIDSNKHNNSASNLEWVTHSENTQHMHDNHYGFVDMVRAGKGFSSETDYVKLITEGYVGGYSMRKGLRSSPLSAAILEHCWVDAGVPSEVLQLNCKYGTSMLDIWNNVITVVEMCRSDMTLKSISKLTGNHHTLYSNIRNGRRWTKEVELYDKYGNDPVYRKNYKPTYKLGSEL